jgi:Fe-S cluster biogenesis protein NfuA
MEKTKNDKLIGKITDTLEKIRPYLIADGGDVSFVELTPELEVKVRLTGACGHCPFSIQTLKAGIEQALLQEIPQIRSVVAV